MLVDQTRDLSWSRRLITLLLDELHIGDEFYTLIETTDRQYPQLVAIALLLRHSWSPEDLADTTAWLRLPSTLPFEPEPGSLLQPTTADPSVSAGSAASTPRTCTPLKGDPTC